MTSSLFSASSALWQPPLNQTPVKLTGIGFKKNHKHPFLTHFEEVFSFCLLAKLSQTGEIIVKDLVSGLEKQPAEESDNDTARFQAWHRIARQTQARYVLSGKLSTPNPNLSDQAPLNDLTIHLVLFDHLDNLIVWEQIISFDHFLLDDPKHGRLIINIQRLNALITQMTVHCLQVLLPHQSTQALGDFAAIPVTQSYQALLYLLQAQKKSANSEKIKLLEHALKEDSNCELAYYHLAKIFRLERHYEQSIVLYRQALEHSRYGPHLQALYATEAGIACALINRNDLALQWWERAIQLYPAYINPYFNIANLYEDQGEYDKAAEYFQQAQSLSPDDFRTFYNLARIYAKLNAWDKALVQYLRQLNDNTQDAWCHSDIATCYLNLGNIRLAAEHLEKTVELDPSGEAGDYARLILANLSISDS